MIAESQTAPHMDTFKEWYSTLIQRAEQDDSLYGASVASKLHKTFKSIFPSTSPESVSSIKTDEMPKK